MRCWADLQSVHGLRCYGNITRTRNVSEFVLVLAVCLVQVVPILALALPSSLVSAANRIPNSITLAGSKLVRSWSQTGSKPNSITLSGQSWSATNFEPASNQIT